MIYILLIVMALILHSVWPLFAAILLLVLGAWSDTTTPPRKRGRR